MKTISRSTWRRRPPYRTLGIALLIGVSLFCLIVWREFFAGVVVTISEPVLASRALLSGALGGIVSQFSSKAGLARENETLKTALASSSVALLERNLLFEENKALRARLGNASEETASFILATIIMRPPATPYDTFLLDAGKKDDVTEGDLVSAGGGSSIGTVTEIYDSASRVTLFSSPGMTYGGLLRRQGKEGDIPLTIRGQGGGSMQGEVPAGTFASIGDFIILDTAMPVLTGIVSYIERQEGNSFEVLYFHLPVNLFELRSVEVRHTPPLYEI